MYVISIPLNEYNHLVHPVIVAAVDTALRESISGNEEELTIDLSTGAIVQRKHVNCCAHADALMALLMHGLINACVHFDTFDPDDIFQNGIIALTIGYARLNSPSMNRALNIIDGFMEGAIYDDIDTVVDMGMAGCMLDDSNCFIAGLLHMCAHVVQSIENTFGYRSILSGRLPPTVKIERITINNSACAITVSKING